MVTLCEVGPRDGLQNLPRTFTVEEKITLITRLAAAGLSSIEAVSMVNPARVPQMAGAEEVLAGLPELPGVHLSALVLNLRGAERALATRIDGLRFAVVASDTFCRRNQGMSSEESVAEFARAAKAARSSERDIVAVIATAYGCPFEGEIAPARVARMVEAMIAAGASQVVLADTIGVAVPANIRCLHDHVAPVLGGRPWGVHLHNTRNTGYANLSTALELGTSVVDASIGGLGGCPFAPRATGNVATEDVNYLMQRSGVATGLDHDRLSDLVDWLDGLVPERITGQLGRAGWFGAEAAA
ncbi:hydroxymethylglutaryl-CoA lyase [Paracoccus tibetensis]|uniref:Hydroxymethylglutaryl-CoA lyase n=1 Tax=Paracoccus tibetensis TaxID=336292 RepID=A0A1G5K6S5_9RHOB|nr:hydroxymethylglutaryl-CoA lyase [Paracoccus tibetensis]SCY96296.1 hydroxymethylglutaryl-CoA lyase [Paracoccus tibetensis]